MLPSTGYFKSISCPFYDSGLCERPYCHFRHVKKESQNTSSDCIESGAILQKLVSEAVQKVLQQKEATVTSSTQITAVENNLDASTVNQTQPVAKAIYNPTPISELNKINNSDLENLEDVAEQKRKHIPVPYTPRKPANLPLKRIPENNGPSKPFIYNPPPAKYTPGCVEASQLDPYTPKGSSESKEVYQPGTEIELQEYTPKNESQSSATKRNYVPSDRNGNKKKKILEYKPTKVSSKSETSAFTYQPTLRSLVPCFSSDEDEPDTKKSKITSDLNGLDDLGAEFDILDQILDEEKLVQTNSKTTKNRESKTLITESNKNTEKTKKSSDDFTNKDNASHKSESKKSQEKSRSVKKEKSSDSKHDSKSKSSSSSHKSHKSSKSKDKDEKRKEKRKHDSKSSDKGSKHTEDSLSKHSSKDLKKSVNSTDDSRKSKEGNRKSHKKSKECKSEHRKVKEKSIEKNLMDDSNMDDDYIADSRDEDVYVSESDEETIALECKRIFEEYVPTEKVEKIVEDTASNINSLNESQENDYIPVKKRISRTVGKVVKISTKPPVKPDHKANSAQIMAERLAKIREYHASKNTIDTSQNDNPVSKSDGLKKIGSLSINSKVRIAHVPYASTLLSAKKSISTNVEIKNVVPSTSSTVIQTVKKGAQRVAHIPNEKFIDRPGVLEPLASKIPANIRSTYLNMMIDECLKIYIDHNDAYARAQHEELATSKKCSTVSIYKNSAVMTISRLRKELQECNGVKKTGENCSALQKIPQATMSKSDNAGSWSIENKYKRVGDNSKEFSGAKFYGNIQKWVLNEQQLQENGFPRPHPSGEKGRAIIYAQNKKKPPVGNIRNCCRCKKDYIVDKKGFAAVKEECIYHPNNKYRVRGEVRYQCCSQDGMSDGCCVAPSHVYEYVDYDNLRGFIPTLPPENEMDDYGVFSLDCEMCYTTHGLDLTRITVINSACKVVYETLIKPLHPIVDYNTRYSGITEEQMRNVNTTLLDVQATLLTMFNSNTILIGHSLESDFKALKLIHDTVIDTSVLFPHKMGPPFKRALKNLCSEHLKKIIQNSVEGHDSAEDASVCMELIIYKLKEYLKTR